MSPAAEDDFDSPTASGCSAMMPIVSILLPIRNEARDVERLLMQLSEQSYPSDRIEIIVIDGMSDDGTRTIVSESIARQPRIRLVDNPGLTLPAALNRGISAARGDILLKVDGHAEVAADYVAKSIALLQAHSDAWGVGGPIVHSGRTTFGKATAAAMSHPAGVGNATHRFADFEGYGEGAAFWTMHRWVFDRVGAFDESLLRTEDDDFNYRLRQAGGRVFLSPTIRSHYFVRDTFGDLFRQYYQYGYWKVPVMSKHRRLTSWRQVVPLAFFAITFVVGIVAITVDRAPIALVLPTAYVTALAVIGLSCIPRVGIVTAIFVPFAMATMHTAYALGMLQGLFVWCFRKGNWIGYQNMTKLTR